MKRRISGKVKQILPELSTKEKYYICPKCMRSFIEEELYLNEIYFCPGCGESVDITRLKK